MPAGQVQRGDYFKRSTRSHLAHSLHGCLGLAGAARRQHNVRTGHRQRLSGLQSQASVGTCHDCHPAGEVGDIGSRPASQGLLGNGPTLVGQGDSCARNRHHAKGSQFVHPEALAQDDEPRDRGCGWLGSSARRTPRRRCAPAGQSSSSPYGMVVEIKRHSTATPANRVQDRPSRLTPVTHRTAAPRSRRTPGPPRDRRPLAGRGPRGRSTRCIRPRTALR